jgi:hypothetical protein
MGRLPFWEPLEDFPEDRDKGDHDQDTQFGGPGGEEIEGVTCTAESEKALRCRFADGTFRWVPKSQVVFDSEVMKKGDAGTLIVTDWMARKWDETEADEPEEGVVIEGVVCLREGAKAIEVRLEDGREMWIPKGQIVPGSEVTGDGDTGALTITKWIANEKGLS